MRLQKSAQQTTNPFEQNRALYSQGMISHEVFNDNIAVARDGGAIFNVGTSSALIGAKDLGEAITNTGKIVLNFDNQANTRAQNVVSNTFSNWEAPAVTRETAQAPASGQTFDNNWIATNQLGLQESNDAEVGETVRRSAVLGSLTPTTHEFPAAGRQPESRAAPLAAARPATLPGQPQPAQHAPPPPPARAPVTVGLAHPASNAPMVPQPQIDAFQDARATGGGGGMGGRGGGMGDGGGMGMGGMGVDYATVAEPEAQQVFSFGFPAMNGGRRPESDRPTVLTEHEADYAFRQEGRDRFMRPGEVAQWGAPLIDPTGSFMITPLATRFASLDIDIPIDGQEFVFTSPRGEIELTARSYAEGNTTRLSYLFLSLLIIAIAVGVERIARRKGL